MRKLLKNVKGNIIPMASGAAMSTMLMTTTVLASSDTSSITAPLENLKTLVIAVI